MFYQKQEQEMHFDRNDCIEIMIGFYSQLGMHELFNLIENDVCWIVDK